MPLPHFLMIMIAVIVAAAATLWISFDRGLPLITLSLAALVAAGIVHFVRRDHKL